MVYFYLRGDYMDTCLPLTYQWNSDPILLFIEYKNKDPMKILITRYTFDCLTKETPKETVSSDFYVLAKH